MRWSKLRIPYGLRAPANCVHCGSEEDAELALERIRRGVEPSVHGKVSSHSWRDGFWVLIPEETNEFGPVSP